MPYVTFVDDTTYKSIVGKILTEGQNSTVKAKQKFNRNVIDPFAVVWELASFKIDFSTWYQTELARQAQKHFQIKLVYFIRPFWVVLVVGKTWVLARVLIW